MIFRAEQAAVQKKSYLAKKEKWHWKVKIVYMEICITTELYKYE